MAAASDKAAASLGPTQQLVAGSTASGGMGAGPDPCLHDAIGRPRSAGNAAGHASLSRQLACSCGPMGHLTVPSVRLAFQNAGIPECKVHARLQAVPSPGCHPKPGRAASGAMGAGADARLLGGRRTWPRSASGVRRRTGRRGSRRKLPGGPGGSPGKLLSGKRLSAGGLPGVRSDSRGQVCGTCVELLGQPFEMICRRNCRWGSVRLQPMVWQTIPGKNQCCCHIRGPTSCWLLLCATLDMHIHAFPMRSVSA